MNALLRLLFFVVFVRPLVFVFLGINMRYGERLPKKGPAMIVANHNSHLDTLVLMSLFPLKLLPRLRPVAAADYFLRNAFFAWFSLKIMGIIPVQRKRAASGTRDPLAGCSKVLEAGDIIILYPEGTRGEPEQMQEFKKGIAHLAKRHDQIPVTPIYLHGLGKSLPKGEGLFVPFFCDVFVGKSLLWIKDRDTYMEMLGKRMKALEGEGQYQPWE